MNNSGLKIRDGLMDYLRKHIKFFVEADEKVAAGNKLGEWRSQAGITLISALAYLIMSVINIIQHSHMMLICTGFSAFFLVLIYLITKNRKNTILARILYLAVNCVMLTIFTIEGGNDGFAALWLILVPFVAMFMVDLKLGFALSLYFMLMLLFVLRGPLSNILDFNYSQMFRVRFPFLYIISFALALFIAIRVRLFQYELLKKQEEIERVSSTDIATGLLNRNSYNKFSDTFVNKGNDSIAAIFADVNGLHRINNAEGHAAGDRMLKRTAELLMKYFGGEKIYRMGGDEFLVFAANHTEAELNEIMKMIVYELSCENYSISFGIASANGQINLSELTKMADQIMLENKEDYYRLNNIEHR